jgi:hypothetical protein
MLSNTCRHRYKPQTIYLFFMISTYRMALRGGGAILFLSLSIHSNLLSGAGSVLVQQASYSK